jgi:subtilisin-like proprotein convertase family protein
MKMLHSSVLLAGLACIGNAGAATSTVGLSWSVGTAIPDNNSSGLVSSQTVTVDISSIDVLTLTLEIDGGWNGDFYAYLQHDTGFSVLLNRPGRTATRLAGSASSGMNITIDDAAAQELHIVPTVGSLSGNWQPDARTIDPAQVLDTSPRGALLSSFNGLDPNGSWTLFIADLGTGDQGTLTSWGMTITGEAVPEPSGSMIVMGALLTQLSRRRRE